MSFCKSVFYTSLLVILSSVNVSAHVCSNKTPECLKQSFQALLPKFVDANPKIGLESLDPFVIDKLLLTLPGNLKLEFKEGTSKGLRSCIIDSARLVEDPVDKVNNTLDLQFHCNLTIKGNYKSTGRLLMFAINGHGQSLIKCKNIKVQLLAKLGSRLKNDGKKHLEIKSFNSSHTYEGQVRYQMTNLINGNPILSALVLEFMNRNWKMVAEEFGKPIVDYGISNILKNIKILFNSVPEEDLFGFSF